MHYSPVRHSPPGASSRAAVRLACVKHAASVQSEPGSNSSVQSLLSLEATNLGSMYTNSEFLELLPSNVALATQPIRRKHPHKLSNLSC